jgi:hypothetical protein
MWLANLSAALLGLLVSALAKTEEWAVALLPIIVLPQLFLTVEVANMHTAAGRFQSVVYLMDQAGQKPREPHEWTVEIASLTTYTRPCVAMLRRPFLAADGHEHERVASRQLARAVNYGHMCACVLLSALALWIVFRLRDQSWVRSLS